MQVAFGGIFGLLILICDIWAIVKIIQSSANFLTKILWVAIIVLLPVLGFFLWFFLGP